jgi:hypothetical protein
MDAPEPPQPAAGGPDQGKRRDDDPVMITDNNRFYLSRPVNKQAYLAVDFRGDGAERSSQVAADNFVGGNIFPGQLFQLTELLGFKTGYVSGYRCDASTSVSRISTALNPGSWERG